MWVDRSSSWQSWRTGSWGQQRPPWADLGMETGDPQAGQLGRQRQAPGPLTGPSCHPNWADSPWKPRGSDNPNSEWTLECQVLWSQTERQSLTAPSDAALNAWVTLAVTHTRAPA